MYKSIKLAMVMAIVVATAGCIVTISDENDAITASDLLQYLNADQTAYVMSGDFSFDDGIIIDKPIEVDGTLDLTIGTYTYSGTEPMFIVEDGDVLKISGTVKTLSMDIDSGELQLNAAVTLQGSATGGKISLISPTATVTLGDSFEVSSTTAIESYGIILLLDNEHGDIACFDKGEVHSYKSNDEGCTLEKVYVSPDSNSKSIITLNKIDGKPLTTIGSNAFDGCTSLETVAFTKANNKYLESGAFSGNHGIKTVNATRVTEIENDVFSGCTTLTTINLTSLTHVTEGMFSGCTALTKLTVGSSCTIDEGAFQGFDDLTVTKGKTDYYVDADGNLTQANAENADFAIHQNNKIYYNFDFDNAVASASSGSIISLLKDVTIEPIQIEKTILTIDLNGKKLTIGNSVSPDNTSTYGIDFVGGTLTIKNGTIEDARDTSRTGGYTTINSVGDLNIENVDLVIYDAANSSNSNNIGYRISNGQTLTMSGNSTITTNSTAEADRGSVGVVVLGIGNSVNTTDLILKDNASIEVGQYGISGNARNTGGGIGDYGGTTITIMDEAKVSASNGWGIYHPQSGSLNIQDKAEITGLTGIEIRSGTLNMTGGEVRSTATANTMIVDPDSGGATTTGVGISVVQHTTKQNIDVDINAGNVSGFYAVFQADIPGNGSESMEKVDIKLNGGSYESTGTEDVATNGTTYSPSSVYGEEKKDMVVGGSYDSNVSDYAAPGYAVVPNPDGTYGPVESESSDDTVNKDGQTVQASVSGDTVTIPVADGGFSDITFDLSFGSTEITIVGDVEKDVTIRYYTFGSTEAELAFELYIDGVVKKGMGVVVAVPVILGENESIDTDTLYAYSVTDQGQTPETVYVSGDYIVVVTDHNTPFYVNYDVVSTVPYPPIWDDDDEYVPPVVPSQTDGSNDDNTTEIVACAAAAVVAALMAAFLIIERRRN